MTGCPTCDDHAVPPSDLHAELLGLHRAWHRLGREWSALADAVTARVAGWLS